MANTLLHQQKRQLYTWASPESQYQNQLIIFFAAKDGEALLTIPGADYGSDHELLIAKFRCKLKKVGKITRPFRYGLIQILHNYTVEMISSFKGLDLIECLKSYGQKFVT